MRVILQKDVKNLGKVGDVLNVKQGYARNFLFPRNLAVIATEGHVKEWQHLQRVAEAKKKKARTERQGVSDKLSGLTMTFKREAGEGDKLFGSVTAHDISKALEEQGYQVDRRDIKLEEPLKVLGQHQVKIQLDEGLESEVKISVEKV